MMKEIRFTVRMALMNFIVHAYKQGGRLFRATDLERIVPHHPLSGLRILREMKGEYQKAMIDKWAKKNRDIIRQKLYFHPAYPDPRTKTGFYIFHRDFIRWMAREKKKKISLPK
jgi:hypothetical protein